MNKTTCVFVLVLGIATMVCAKQILPPWVDCTSNSDCAPGFCCAIPMERYSYPSCRRMNEDGEPCRPGGPLTTNGTRYYPGNLEINLDNVYVMFCPCNDGFACDRDESVCRDSSILNAISEQHSSKKDD